MKIENIKAKRLDGKGWVEGYFYKECDNTYIIEDRQSESPLNRNIPHLVVPTTVCQFTGLKDENGENIWEHDILESPFLKGEVIFFNGCFRVKKDDGSSLSFPTLSIINGKLRYFSVVGNKFDKEK